MRRFALMKYLTFLLLVLFGTLNLRAQHVELRDYRLFDSVTVIQHNDSLSFPWMGGFLHPIFSEINLNGDSLSDLIIFDKGSFEHNTFIRKKSGPHYSYNRTYKNGPTPSRFFSLFEDFNGDGLEDQLFNDDGFVAMNKNISSNPNELKFERLLFKDPNNANRKTINASFEYNGNTFGLTAGPVEIPAFADLDGDNDLDIAVLAVGLGTVYFYENTGANKYASLDSFQMTLTNFCWGGFEDNLNGFYVNLGNCKGRFLPSGSRHGGANLTATHLDCNGLTDLMIGFADEEKVIGLFNGGTAKSGRITAQDTSFPKNTTTIQMPLFPNVNALKINEDSDEDFLIGPMDDLNSANHKQIQYYASSTDTTCFKRDIAQDFLSSECIDMGEQSRYVLIDVNGDSLLDIIGSSLKLQNRDSTWNAIFYWKNIGTKNRPAFKLISEDFLSIPFSNTYDASVYKVDLDNDGSQDLVLANEDGRMKWLKNMSLPSDSGIFVATTSSLDSLKLSSFPRLCFFDINGDSLPDLLSGSLKTSLDYYQNKGSLSNADFNKSPTQSNFAGIAISDAMGTGYLQPAFAVTDTSGSNADTVQKSMYLYIGAGNGWLYQYKNDSSSFDKYELLDSVYLFNRFITPSTGDLNGDEKTDMIIGMNTGGASLLMKDIGFLVPPPKEKDEDPEVEDTLSNRDLGQLLHWNIFPNPASSEVTVQSKVDSNEETRIQIMDLNGRVLAEDYFDTSIKTIDVSSLPKGMYVISINSSTRLQVERLVKR